MSLKTKPLASKVSRLERNKRKFISVLSKIRNTRGHVLLVFLILGNTTLLYSERLWYGNFGKTERAQKVKIRFYLFWLRKVFLNVSRCFRKTYTANVCSHKTKQQDIMQHGDGRNTIMEMPLADNGNPDYCVECIGKLKCA